MKSHTEHSNWSFSRVSVSGKPTNGASSSALVVTCVCVLVQTMYLGTCMQAAAQAVLVAYFRCFARRQAVIQAISASL